MKNNRILKVCLLTSRENPRDRSQFSVEASGLFSNMVNFHECRYVAFLIQLLIAEICGSHLGFGEH